MTLRDLAIGKSGRVVAVVGEGALRHRLLEMGITPHTVVTVKKAAPMGDPIELLIRGYVLTLRLDDAEKIIIDQRLESDRFENRDEYFRHDRRAEHDRYDRRDGRERHGPGTGAGNPDENAERGGIGRETAYERRGPGARQGRFDQNAGHSQPNQDPESSHSDPRPNRGLFDTSAGRVPYGQPSAPGRRRRLRRTERDLR